jgi:lipopolysaccharide/colanic/teichoic acid biosynthesis glycosyltransferase
LTHQQLWNVLRGDMSLVDHGPSDPEFIARLTEAIPFYGLGTPCVPD